MQIFEVDSLKKIEEYIKERDYYIDYLDNFILQYLARNLTESQYFIILKDSKAKELEKIKAKLLESTNFAFLANAHQPSFIGKLNNKNKIILKKWITLYPKYGEFADKFLQKKDFNSFRYGLDECELSADSVNLKIKYKNDYLIILEFILKIFSMRYNDYSREMNFYENGFYIDENNPSQIIPYNDFYWYHYKIITFEKLKEMYGLEYLRKKEEENKKNLLLLEKKLKQKGGI